MAMARNLRAAMPQKTDRKGRITPEFIAQAGKGRPKGVKNKTTLAMKDAISSVYADLQSETGDGHGHFKAWAKDNPTEFYKIAAKLIPMQVDANVDLIGMPAITLAPGD
jgi:hypothetical protein